MNTLDGFAIEHWQQLARLAIQWGKLDLDKLQSASLPEAMKTHQVNLQRRAIRKFSDPERWIWSNQLLEQSSDEKTARLSAEAFPKNVRVVDVCCGAGADSVALANRGIISAVDRCDVACELTRANLAMHGYSVSNHPSNDETFETMNREGNYILCRPADSITIDSNTWIHIDPDRRAQATRTIRAEFFQPDLDTIMKIVDRSAGGSIKVAPATKWELVTASENIVSNFHAARSDFGRQFVAWGGSVRQQRWWWNIEPYAANSVTVSLIDRTGEWKHWMADAQAMQTIDDWSDIEEDWQYVDGFVGDADGVVRAAGLQHLLAQQWNARRIGNSFGYFVRRDPPTIDSPFVDWFQIDAVMPFDRKKLRAYLREHHIGILEIKVRNMELDPSPVRKELKLSGSESATLLVTRCGSRTIAIVGQRFDKSKIKD